MWRLIRFDPHRRLADVLRVPFLHNLISRHVVFALKLTEALFSEVDDAGTRAASPNTPDLAPRRTACEERVDASKAHSNNALPVSIKIILNRI